MAMMNEMEYRTIGSALAGGYRAAVYCRLSKDDDLQGESASIPQRIYIGGYHATSHTRCYLAFTGLALICILLSKVIAANHLFRILTTAALMGIAIFFSPIEATNKPLGKKKRLSYKMVASVLSSIDFLFAIFNVLPDTRSITVYYISKWVLVIFAIIPFFQKQAKIS